jgi:hypothetical protein
MKGEFNNKNWGFNNKELSLKMKNLLLCKYLYPTFFQFNKFLFRDLILTKILLIPYHHTLQQYKSKLFYYKKLNWLLNNFLQRIFLANLYLKLFLQFLSILYFHKKVNLIYFNRFLKSLPNYFRHNNKYNNEFIINNILILTFQLHRLTITTYHHLSHSMSMIII